MGAPNAAPSAAPHPPTHPQVHSCLTRLLKLGAAVSDPVSGGAALTVWDTTGAQRWKLVLKCWHHLGTGKAPTYVLERTGEGRSGVGGRGVRG